MRLLQATWDLNGSLLVWGEQTRTASASAAPAQDPEGDWKERPLGPHPFACSFAQLSADLNELGFAPAEQREIDIFLPSDKYGPWHSAKLLSDDEFERNGDTVLELWQVPAAVLDPVTALTLLTSLPHQLPAGLKLDDSIKYWREPTKLVLELLSHGRFVPGVIRRNNQWYSHWQVFPSLPDDHSRLSVLAECMPPVCRAVVQKDSAKTIPPNALLESFISGAADALIRFFLRRDNFMQAAGQDHLPPRLVLPSIWLASLTSAEPLLSGSGYELIKFEQQLRNWAGSLLSSTASHRVSTAFRLAAPAKVENVAENGEMRWPLEFLLLSNTAAGQELGAARLWRGDLGFLKSSDMTQEDLEDLLLKDLGKALEVFPALKPALEQTHPASMLLTTAEAYLFLREDAKRLEAQGFTVILPEWWSKPRVQLGLHLHVNSEEADCYQRGSFGFLASTQLLDYSWQVSLGENKLSLDQFRDLVLAHAPLVQADGQWIELEEKKLAATLAFLERQAQKEETLHFIDVLRLGLGADELQGLLPVVGLSATGWVKRILDRESHEFTPLSEPEGFCGTLRPYQREGLGWLAMFAAVGVGGCLADDMGLGKTIQMLALLLHERQIARESSPPAEVKPTLLIVPMSILNNWEYESRRFAPALRCYTHHGPERLTAEEFRAKAEQSDLVLTTYSLANRDEDLLAGVSWGRITLDEAQNIKNLEAKQTKAIKRLVQECMLKQSSSYSCQRLALTGTPLENHLEELWSIFDFLNPGFLGTVHEFRSRFVQPIESFRSKEQTAQLNQLIRPFILRRLKADPSVISDLPEKIEMEVFTTLTEEQAALYQSVLEQMLPQVENAAGIHRKGLVLATITRLKQICDHPVLFLKDESPLSERSGKLALLEEILDTVLAEGDKALIFTQYAQMGHLLKPYLQERLDAEVLFLHGGLSKGARDKVVEKFRKPDGPRVFVLSLKAGGLGLNLTEANQVIHFDQWWNPAVQEQATDRAYRIGQLRTVQVRKFICRGTLEERIQEMLGFKRNLMEQIVGSTRNAILELSVAELKNLLQLTAEQTY